jgi:histidinol-phosphate aminotransferase
MNRRSFIQSGIALSSVAGSCVALGAQVLGADLCAEERIPEVEPSLVRLRSAENPYGPPKSALAAAQSELRIANRYPRSKVAAFRELIAKVTGLTADHVAIGAGSIELMINTGLAYGKPGRAVLSADPTWNTTAIYAQACGAEWIRVPLMKDFRADFDRMHAAITDKVDLVYICNPNNPTGIAENHAELEAFVKDVAKSRLVMIDEAFVDCLDGAEQLSMKKLLPEYENVVIARTFSKLWGMAGFRIGYMLGHPAVIKKLKSTIPTLEMQNRIGLAAAMAAYQDGDFIEQSRQRTKAARQTVYEILDRHGLSYIRSDTNFVSFQVSEHGKKFIAKLAGHGVAIKAVSLNSDPNWARVSCGTPEELEVFDATLGKVTRMAL